MKRPRQHVLEDESRQALKNILPSEWIPMDIHPDYGLDMQVTIVNGEEVTSKVFSVQIKATDSASRGNTISLPIETKNLKYYETYPLPVFILYYIKPVGLFYYLFAQKYIRDSLSKESPRWRNQQTATVTFSPQCIFKSGDQINSVVVDSALYLTMSQLNKGDTNPVYWIDGIPKSDDKELKALTLKALDLSNKYQFKPAIDAFERILILCTMSPTERMSILVSIGNAYDSLSLFDDALDKYLAAEELLPKINSVDSLTGKACIFSGLGRVYSSKSRYPEALSYHRKALKLFRKTGYAEGEAGTLNNIGNIYREQGELRKAAYNMRLALKLHQSSKDIKGQAIVLGNIGNIYNEKGNLPVALKYYHTALRMHSKVGNLVAQANMLGSIGSVHGMRHETKKAVSYLKRALTIFKSVGELEGQATTFLNLSNIYLGNNMRKSMEYATASLNIDIKIGNRHGQALCLATIGNIHGLTGYPEEALRCCELAQSILVDIGEKTNLPMLKSQISNLKSIVKFLES